LFQAVAWAVLCFAPRGTCPPEYAPEDLQDNLDRQVAEVADWGDQGLDKAFSGWVERSHQPELLTMLLTLTLTWQEKAPPKFQARPEAKALLIAALRAVVDTLDEAARSGS
jgi:hypothetical protein